MAKKIKKKKKLQKVTCVGKNAEKKLSYMLMGL